MRKFLLSVTLMLGMTTSVFGQMIYGVNLSSAPIQYDCTSLVFADLFKSAGTFNGYRGVAPIPPLIANGWPSQVNAKTGPTNLILALNATLPGGTYIMKAKGTGRVQVTGFNGLNWAGVNFNGDGIARGDDGKPITLVGPAGKRYQGQIELSMTQSASTDPLRDMQFFLPGHENQTFNRAFLNTLKPFSYFRFMDWQTTNGSTLKEWTDRLKPGFSYAQQGRISDEIICELANTLKKDVWISIPGLASQDYIAKMAKNYDTLLSPELTIYIEFSNEVWNDQMPQFGQFAKLRALQTAIPGGWEFIASLDALATKTFKANLSPSRKSYIVLARQASYPATLTVAMNQYKAQNCKFEMISCGGYFYSKPAPNTMTVFKTNPAQALTMYFAGMSISQQEFIGYMKWYKDQATAAKVPFAVYEGGQHLGNPNDADQTTLSIAANRDPRMYDMYKAWAALQFPDTRFTWFNDCAENSKWGSWGLKEDTMQPLTTAHKMRAAIEVIPPPLNPVTLLDTIHSFGLTGYVKQVEDGSFIATTGIDGNGKLINQNLVPRP